MNKIRPLSVITFVCYISNDTYLKDIRYGYQKLGKDMICVIIKRIEIHKKIKYETDFANTLITAFSWLSAI